MMSTSIASQAMAISAALPESTGPEIIAATGLPNGSVKQAIWELQRAGLVAGTPKAGRDFSKYWRV